jgi:hypothetical protein
MHVCYAGDRGTYIYVLPCIEFVISANSRGWFYMGCSLESATVLCAHHTAVTMLDGLVREACSSWARVLSCRLVHLLLDATRRYDLVLPTPKDERLFMMQIGAGTRQPLTALQHAHHPPLFAALCRERY